MLKSIQNKSTLRALRFSGINDGTIEVTHNATNKIKHYKIATTTITFHICCRANNNDPARRRHRPFLCNVKGTSCVLRLFRGARVRVVLQPPFSCRPPPPPTTAAIMAKFELTSKICQFLDPHLTFPLLEFQFDKNVSNQTSEIFRPPIESVLLAVRIRSLFAAWPSYETLVKGSESVKQWPDYICNIPDRFWGKKHLFCCFVGVNPNQNTAPIT